MIDALTAAFPHAVTVLEGPDRRRRWKLNEVPLSRLRLNGADELEALETAIAALQERGDALEARRLRGLRDRLVAALPANAARAAEADAEAVLEAHGQAARPGPAVRIALEVFEAVAAALRGPFRLRLFYGGKLREVEPYGVLLGARRYLVAREPGAGEGLKHFRFDRIEAPEVTENWFAKDSDFSLKAHAARAFGSYQDDSQFGRVTWRFTPEASDQAEEWEFHPGQTSRRDEAGALVVSFEASGWLEMAWHLYMWGDAVEVLEPKGLRQLVEGWQRADFEALP
ncbi:MAG: WYL domain-containing protein [Silicimonas sp.]